MNLFKPLTLKWYQTSIFKIGMLTLGIVVGVYFHGLFGGYLMILLVGSALMLVYISYLWWNQ